MTTLIARIPKNTARIEARISIENKQLLIDAAALSGRKLTDFIFNSAYEEAKRILRDHQQLHLSAVDQEIFMKAILNPPKPNKKMTETLKLYNKKVKSI